MEEKEKSLLSFSVTTPKLNYQVLGFKHQQKNLDRALVTDSSRINKNQTI